ncbi:MAG: DUF4136 domain-containing protein [Pseudomonadales bacterium]|nr:DUF4136 domain-containing protein [Pseudomonadales bacterium]
MKTTLIATLTLVLALLTGCSSDLEIGSDFDESVDFSTYSSYRWHDGNEFNLTSRRYLASDLADQRIRNNVNDELSAKGIRLRENGPVDFLVNYTVVTADRVDIDSYNTYSGYAPGWQLGGYSGVSGSYRYGYAYGRMQTTTQTSEVVQGTLVLDFIGPNDNILVWRGIAEGQLDPTANQREREALISEAVARILDGFPPEQG